MDNFKTSMIHFSKHSTVDVTSYVQSVFDSVEVQNINKDPSDQTKIELKDIKNDFSIDDNTNEETTLIIHKYNITDTNTLLNYPTTCEFLNHKVC